MSNEDAVILTFIKRNIRLLLSHENVKEEIKHKKFEYFKINLKGKLGFPKNTELAKKLVYYCIDHNIIKKIEDLDSIIKNSEFLRESIFDKDVEEFKNIISQSSLKEEKTLVLSAEDLKHLREKEYVEKKEEEIGKNIEKYHRSKIEKEYQEKIESVEKERQILEKEKEQLQKFKSQIDEWREKEISENDLETNNIKEEKLENRAVWWRRLGLIQDPFPTTDGLSRIDPKYYDEIILKTKIFNEYYNIITSHPKELLHKTYIVCGEFGSGKTTLFDFLKKPLILSDMLPIHIIIDAENDADFMRKIFFKEVFKQLNDKSKELINSDLRAIFQDIDKGVIASTMHEINEKTKISGFVIFIDGLHKNESHTLQVISFIQSLQNTKDYLTRDGIELSIFIAGSKRWKRELSFNPSLSGSRYRIDEMPEITDVGAYEMFSKRFKTFSIDKNNPTKIKRQDIEKIYKFLKGKFSRDVTFRDFVDEVIPRLEKSEFGIIEVSLKHDLENLKLMKQELEKSEELYSRLTSIKGLFKKRNDDFFLCLKVLIQIYEGIEESEELFMENKAIFGVLYRFGLIEKYISGNNFKWGPSKLVKQHDHEVKQKYGFKIDDYLVEAFDLDNYEENTSPSLSKQEEIDILENIRSSQKNLGSYFNELMALLAILDK